MLLIFTGNGKGKTTAALGQALRAIGTGKRVLMVQFIKGPWKSGEDESVQKLAPDFTLVKMGRGFVGIGGDTLSIAEHRKAAQAALAYARQQTSSKQWHLLILDEIWNALALTLLTPESVHEFITDTLPHLDHLIMTGRDCPQEFIERADLVTEMKEIKHPFTQGVQGTKGLES